ncbi:MAG: hypothetical protein E6R03_18505 [Hyphomicrobiaceae bacterium]|nr:MAG: hypothetical protein E6R03_18505 [Hyphomicrobiaceae bacterium]
MGWRSGTDFAKIDVTVGTLPPVREHVIPAEEGVGQIPPNLATMTMLLLAIHASNDDLAWVADMVREMEDDRALAARDEACTGPLAHTVRNERDPGAVETEKRYEMLFAHVTPDAARQIAESITDAESADDPVAQVLVRQLADIAPPPAGA